MKTCNKTQKLTKQNDRTTNFARTKRKKNVSTQDKHPTHRKIILQMNALKQYLSMHVNVHQRTLHIRSKPGHGRQQQFCRSETPEEKFLK